MTSSESSVSFIVFALNEERNIGGTVETLRHAVSDARITNYQIVLVNDGSADNTGKIMEGLASADGKITVVHNERNLGPGGAFKRGAAAARCEYLMPIAGDNAAPAESISATIVHLGEADILIVYIANSEIRSFRRQLGAYAFKTVINVLFGYKMPYYNGAVPRRELFNKINIHSDGYAFFAEMVVKLMRLGSSYVSIGVEHTVDANASSSALKPKNLVKVLRDLVHLVGDVRRSDAVLQKERSVLPRE
jgi:glycosyltransferase involved in cell wall biosynthesis